MIGVFIVADTSDKKMWKILPDIILRNLEADFIQPGSPARGADRERLVIAEAARAARLRPDEAIIIFKGVAELPCSFPAGERTVAVVDSGDTALLEKVSATMLPAITCGLSSRDTLTLSSIAPDSAVITVQRSISCFDGSVADPQEIPVSLRSPIDSFTLMAAGAVFLLSGNADLLAGAEF